ncbi:hypothetical protein DIPPA_25054 [Diplonema papillatum]|nr:hypothetical protein DIPPA_25054 [Diplonema papillatum]
MPCDYHVEEKKTEKIVWLSEHDPMTRMKGMHGICVSDGSSVVELKGRLFNRTACTRTFLWWANVAALVHDEYESFFPPDVRYVADHAVRATTSFPFSAADYYGVKYGDRAPANDLRWYKNIPVPTSYMVCDTEYNFFGGYDHKAGGGFIHVASKHVAPGKKQWTWGDDAFGRAWDRELTDENGPYIELMAGVYTDNQPDFSYLLPYETKTFSQYWWPYKKIGPVQNASRDAALRLVVGADGELDLGVAVSKPMPAARVTLAENGVVLVDETADLSPERPWQCLTAKSTGGNPAALTLTLHGVLSYRPADESLEAPPQRSVATEPAKPEAVETVEELVLIAEHLVQYRHPTRYPEAYWAEALKRDPSDFRTNLAWGRAKLEQGLFEEACGLFTTAVQRLTRWHPNPSTGEAHYYLGLARVFRGDSRGAYAAFYKAAWNYEWRAASYYNLALLDCRERRFEKALEHCESALDTNRQNNKAVVLKAVALRKLGRDAESKAAIRDLLAVDPLDHWARYEADDAATFLSKTRNDAQTVLDIVYDYADAGCCEEALTLLQLHHDNPTTENVAPNPLKRSHLTHYAAAWLQDLKEPGQGTASLAAARSLPADYCFPSRLHDQVVLQWAAKQPGGDRNAFFGLGNYYYDRKRHHDAIAAWEAARAADPTFATVCRNLGIAYWNTARDRAKAREMYEAARRQSPGDARVLSEFVQLQKKLGDAAEDRLTYLRGNLSLANERDDCVVELAELHNAVREPGTALEIILGRTFHPWEGGEGKVLEQYKSAYLQLGQRALQAGDAAEALRSFDLAGAPPATLGEAYHLLQAKADLNYWRGKALRALRRDAEAERCFAASAEEAGDFQAMAVTEHSELTYYRILALAELGRQDDAARLLQDLDLFAQNLRATKCEIDYFATSLPLLLVFEDDMQEAQNERAARLLHLARSALEEIGTAAGKNQA